MISFNFQTAGNAGGRLLPQVLYSHEIAGTRTRLHDMTPTDGQSGRTQTLIQPVAGAFVRLLEACGQPDHSCFLEGRLAGVIRLSLVGPAPQRDFLNKSRGRPGKYTGVWEYSYLSYSFLSTRNCAADELSAADCTSFSISKYSASTTIIQYTFAVSEIHCSAVRNAR